MRSQIRFPPHPTWIMKGSATYAKALQMSDDVIVKKNCLCTFGSGHMMKKQREMALPFSKM